MMYTSFALTLLLLASVGTPSSAKEKECKKSDFDCGEKCIPKKFVCDGFFDCGTGNDELDCKIDLRSGFHDEAPAAAAPPPRRPSPASADPAANQPIIFESPAAAAAAPPALHDFPNEEDAPTFPLEFGP